MRNMALAKSAKSLQDVILEAFMKALQAEYGNRLNCAFLFGTSHQSGALGGSYHLALFLHDLGDKRTEPLRRSRCCVSAGSR